MSRAASPVRTRCCCGRATCPAGRSARLELAGLADRRISRASSAAAASPPRRSMTICVKPVARGLAPGRWYFYRFVDARGRYSRRSGGRGRCPTGRSRASASASSPAPTCRSAGSTPTPMPPRADDLDLVVHVGDYLYEYAARHLSRAPARRWPARLIEPASEIVRARRLSAALRRLSRRSRPPALHRAVPDGDDVGRP